MACLSNGTDDAPAVAAGTEQSKRKRPDMSTAENAKRWKGKARGAPYWPSRLHMTVPYGCV